MSAGARVGPYEILSRLGAGGMGEVYRARDRERGREVAIKLPRKDVLSDLERGRRFDQEARAAAALHHPNTVAILEVNELEGLPYMVMELVEGRTLRDRISEGPFPMDEVLPIATQVARGLAEMHATGIVHRDLKPGNIMVSREGRVKVLDFGLVRYGAWSEGVTSEEVTAPQVTRSGVVLGTVPYMSPEQAAGRAVDFRSDQFSLGSTLYEMVTGRRAFRRGTTSLTLAAVIESEPESVERFNDGVPGALVGVITRCLAKDPGRRYGSTRELAKALAGISRRQAAAVSG